MFHTKQNAHSFENLLNYIQENEIKFDLVSDILIIDYVMFEMSYLKKRKKIFVKNCQQKRSQIIKNACF